MLRLRAFCAAIIALNLVSVPLIASPRSTSPLGIVIAANGAHIGATVADVGTTLYGGDRVSTEPQGSMQVRAGAARLLLLSASAAIVDDSGGAPSARLLSGTATFSTGNARAFTLYASKAAIRPRTDAPTVGSVTYVNEKELLVTARHGDLIVSVEDEEQAVPEGSSFRVLLDPPDASAQGPQGGPVKAGKSRYLLVTSVLVAVGTGIAIYYACESPDRP